MLRFNRLVVVLGVGGYEDHRKLMVLLLRGHLTCERNQTRQQTQRAPLGEGNVWEQCPLVAKQTIAPVHPAVLLDVHWVRSDFKLSES